MVFAVRSRVPALAAAATAVVLSGSAAASPAEPIAPDLECFDTPGPRLDLELELAELDPALLQLGLAPHRAVVREQTATCVPVARRGARPAADALPTLQAIALACYRIDAAALPAPARLGVAHASSAPALLPGDDAVLLRPVELCLPVARADAVAPDVRRLVQFVALECHAARLAPRPDIAIAAAPLPDTLAAAMPPHALTLGGDREVCMPVARNTERIPSDVLGVVQRLAFEKIAATPAPVARRPGPAPGPPSIDLALAHLSPRLVTLPVLTVALGRASGWLLPVVRRGPAIP